MKILGNFFVFNSDEEFLDLLKDTNQKEWEYKTGPGKPGTLISPRLRKHWVKDFRKINPHKWVITYNRFNGDGSYQYMNAWPEYFEGERLIINDCTDKIFCYYPYLLRANIDPRFIYLKKNLSRNNAYSVWQEKPNRRDFPGDEKSYLEIYDATLNKQLFPAADCPPAGNLKVVIDHDLEWKPFKDRKYEIFFGGQARSDKTYGSGYMVGTKVEGIYGLLDIVKRKGWKQGKEYLIVDKNINLKHQIEKDFGIKCEGEEANREAYMRTIQNSKFCYNFSIGPLRNRREWEILLGGGCLVQDPIASNATMERDIMEEEKHYTLFDPLNLEKQLESFLENQERYEKIAREGYELARKSFLSIPTLEFRLMMMYNKGRKRIRTYEELEKCEIEEFGEVIWN